MYICCMNFALLVNECSESMVVGEGDKVQFGESPWCFHWANGVRVFLVPSWGIDVVIIGQIVQVFYQTPTEAHLRTGLVSYTAKFARNHDGGNSYFLQAWAVKAYDFNTGKGDTQARNCELIFWPELPCQHTADSFALHRQHSAGSHLLGHLHHVQTMQKQHTIEELFMEVQEYTILTGDQNYHACTMSML